MLSNNEMIRVFEQDIKDIRNERKRLKAKILVLGQREELMKKELAKLKSGKEGEHGKDWSSVQRETVLGSRDGRVPDPGAAGDV